MTNDDLMNAITVLRDVLKSAKPQLAYEVADKMIADLKANPLYQLNDKNIMQSKLTVKEALELGFEYAGQKDTGWQNYVEISDLHETDIKSDGYYLASKDKTHPSIDEKSLLELITEDIDCRFCDETGCDDSTVSDALHGLDLSTLTNEINERLSVIWSSTLTDIQLIP